MVAWGLTALRNLDMSLTRRELEVVTPIDPVVGSTVIGLSLVDAAGAMVAADAVAVGE
jgi:hypothetical protein